MTGVDRIVTVAAGVDEALAAPDAADRGGRSAIDPGLDLTSYGR